MNEFSWERFWEIPVVGILRGFSDTAIEPLLQASFASGLKNVEITMGNENSARQIEMAKSSFGDKLNIGVGTVCSLEDLEIALRAGATFVITPALVPEVITECTRRGVPVFPGAYSPTEIFQAWKLGADIVKIFPASDLGPSYLKDIKGPFPQIPVMPTGGVTPETLGDFARAGACAFGVGGQLYDKNRVNAGDWEAVQQKAQAFVEAWERVKPYATNKCSFLPL